jgi:hypothetical protein
MHNKCVQTVFSAGEILGKAKGFYTQSTVDVALPQTGLSFTHNFRTICAQAWTYIVYKCLYRNSPYILKLYPFPTGPINTTNLIKE